MEESEFRSALRRLDYSGKEIDLFVDLAKILDNIRPEYWLERIRNLIALSYSYSSIRSILWMDRFGKQYKS